MYWNKPIEVLSPATESDKPAITVLPFLNLSDDQEQEYFVDGMTDDLITDHSKVSGLMVISRNSVFTYKNNQKRVEEVARELGVRYVLEGSVRTRQRKDSCQYPAPGCNPGCQYRQLSVR